jgi:CII-binding regulator of phage lambda lysogenization HflD
LQHRKERQMEHLKHASETLKKHLKTLENQCKHMQYPDKTLATYMWNICIIQINTLATYVRKHR